MARTYKTGAIIDWDSLSEKRRVLRRVKIDDGMSSMDVSKIMSALVTTEMYELLDLDRREAVEAGRLRVLVDMDGNQVNIPIEKNGQK